MEYRAENKICQNCKQSFSIESEDFNFYEKIKVPPPTFCPECRTVRRLCWRNERSLFKRTCAKTGKQIITMFHPDAKVVIYDHDVWWSDEWEPTTYGKEYDFSKPFFQQFKELLERTPLANLGNVNCLESPYGNHNLDNKHCYLTYASYNNERTHYSYGAVGLKDCLDIYLGPNSELSYDDTLCGGLYKTHFSYCSEESINSFFLKNCKNLQDCIGCVNLRNKTHCIFNVQYTKEEYEKKKHELDFGSYKILSNFEEKYNEFCLNFPNKYAKIINSHNVTGDNISNSKNLKSCFNVYNNMEDSKYVMHSVELKDSYDIYGGGIASLIYEGVDVGMSASEELFGVLTHECLNTRYTYMCYNSKNLFGCIGLRSKQYCILNKQYSKEEYEDLLPRIIKHMSEMPYVDTNGKVYKFGEFFPSEISPFSYNESIAQEYFTKTEAEVKEKGFKYRPSQDKDYKVTIQSENLPDHIKNVDESILDQVISCPNQGSPLTKCTTAYRIIKSELEFLKNNNIALPRYCPNCRHFKRLKQRNPFKLWSSACKCAGSSSENNKYQNTVKHSHSDNHCPNEFETSYAPDRPEIVYCEKCYQQEVY